MYNANLLVNVLILVLLLIAARALANIQMKHMLVMFVIKVKTFKVPEYVYCVHVVAFTCTLHHK